MYMKIGSVSKGNILSNNIFYTAYIIYIPVLIFNSSLYGQFVQISQFLALLRYISYGLVCIKIVIDLLKRVYNLKELIIIFFISCIITCGAVIAKHKIVLILWFFILAARNINFEKLIKISIYVHIIPIIIVIVGALTGIIENRLFVQEDRERYSLGFEYTTTLSHHFFCITLMYLYHKSEKLTWKETIILIIIGYAVFKVTVTRSAFASSLLAIAGAWILKLRVIKKENRIKVFLVKWWALICAVLSVCGTIFYNELIPGYVILNNLLNNRLREGKAACLTFGYSILGMPISWSTPFLNGNIDPNYIHSNHFVDSSYVRILLNYGVLTLILVVSYFILLGSKGNRSKNNYFCWCLCMILFYSMFDPQLIWMEYNTFLFGLG